MLADSGFRSALASTCETNDRETCVHPSHVASSEITEKPTWPARLKTFPLDPGGRHGSATCVKSSDSHGYGQENDRIFDRFKRVSGIGDDDQITG